MEIVPAFLIACMVSMNPRVGVGLRNVVTVRSYQRESETCNQFIAKMCLQPFESWNLNLVK